jgi:hypothetical protein
MPPAPSSTGGAVPKEMPPQEDLAPIGVGAEPSGPQVRVDGDPHTWGGLQIWWAD